MGNQVSNVNNADLQNISDDGDDKKPQEYSFDAALKSFQAVTRISNRGHFTNVNVLRGAALMSPLFEAASTVGAHIAGGAVRWMCSPNPIPVPSQDVDIFPKDHASALTLETMLHNINYVTQTITPMSIDLTIKNEYITGTLVDKVQIVLPRKNAYMHVGVETAEEQLHTLDFSVARIALLNLDLKEDASIQGNAIADSCFLEDEAAMRLVIKHIVCPISSVKRLMKYSRKGYTCATIDIVKLFAEWTDRSIVPPVQVSTPTISHININQSPHATFGTSNRTNSTDGTTHVQVPTKDATSSAHNHRFDQAAHPADILAGLTKNEADRIKKQNESEEELAELAEYEWIFVDYDTSRFTEALYFD